MHWSESSILREARPRLFTVSYDALLPCLLFIEVGHVKEIKGAAEETAWIQTSCGGKLPALVGTKYRNHFYKRIFSYSQALKYPNAADAVLAVLRVTTASNSTQPPE